MLMTLFFSFLVCFFSLPSFSLSLKSLVLFQLTSDAANCGLMAVLSQVSGYDPGEYGPRDLRLQMIKQWLDNIDLYAVSWKDTNSNSTSYWCSCIYSGHATPIIEKCLKNVNLHFIEKIQSWAHCPRKISTAVVEWPDEWPEDAWPHWLDSHQGCAWCKSTLSSFLLLVQVCLSLCPYPFLFSPCIS